MQLADLQSKSDQELLDIAVEAGAVVGAVDVAEAQHHRIGGKRTHDPLAG